MSKLQMSSVLAAYAGMTMMATSEEQTTAQSAINPTIVANFDNLVDMKDFKFRWKKDKLGNQRPSVELKAPVPSIEGIVSVLEKGGKELELMQDAFSDVVRDAVAAYLSENTDATQASVNAATIVYDVKNADGTVTKKTVPAFSWEGIANQPRAERAGASIPDDQWEAFAADYIAVMPGVTQKSVQAVTNATLVYLKKFSIVKTQKEVLSKLKEQLTLYVNSSKNAEEYSEIIELLQQKLDTYLKANDVELLVANL